MDYRSRWQQKRRRRQTIRLVLVPLVLLAVVLISLLVRALGQGALSWMYEGPADNVVSPVVTANLVVAAFSEGQVRCLRVVDGSEVWEAPFRRPQRFTSAPAVAKGVAVIAADYGKVYAVGLVDGDLNWEIEVPGALRGRPLIADTTVYLASSNGQVHAIDLITGERLFATDAGAVLSEQPALSGRVLVVAGKEGIIVGLDAGSGQHLWRSRLNTNVISRPVPVDDMIAIGSEQGRMQVIDPADGQIKFTAQAAGMIRTPAVAHAGSMYFCDTDGWLHKHDLRTGQRRFSRRLGESLQAGPLMYGDYIYCLVDGRRVVKVDLEEGLVKRYWSVDTAACLMAVGSQHIVVGTHDGRIVAVEMPF